MSNGYRIPFEDLLKCSICQDRIKDARSLPCGHTFCKGCLTRFAGSSYPRGSLSCSECKQTSQLSPTGAECLPRCFVINSLVEDIDRTFGRDDSSRSSSRRSSVSNGQDGQLSLGQHGFQVKETFSCSFCLNLMRDARYLPCGHSFCKECLTLQPRSTPYIKCSKCLKDHTLPVNGIAGLPVAYRVNGIINEIRSNESQTIGDLQPSSSQSRQSQPRFPHHRAPDTRSTTTVMEDVDEAKRRAQARVQQIQVFVRQLNGRTLTIDVPANATVADLKREISVKGGIDQAQQRLTFCGKNLDQNTRLLSSYGITSYSNIDMNVRLRGGNQ